MTAAFLAAALTLPAVAQAQDGYVGLTYSDAHDIDTDALTLNGGVAVDLGGAKLQFNAAHARADVAGTKTSASDFTAHAYVQDENYAVGGFVSATDLIGTGVYGIGVEGSYYFGNLTLSGVAAYNGGDNGFGHFNNYGVAARYFVTDNVSVAANYDRLDYSGGGDADVYGVEAEFQTQSPVSVFASWGKTDAGGGLDTDRWSLGARYTFGGKSLKAQERSGAKTMRSTSSIARLAF